MSTADVAKEYGLHPDTVRDYARRGIIRAKNFRGRRGYYFNEAEVHRSLSLHFGNEAEKEIVTYKRRGREDGRDGKNGVNVLQEAVK